MGANAPSPQIEAMRKLGMTDEEIADILACDKAIDRGADPFPLDPDLEKGAKKARQADRTDTPKPRAKTENTDKRFLINQLSATADYHARGDVEIVNPEREFLFTYNGTRYRVVLSVPRGQ